MFDQLSPKSPIDYLEDALYRWRGIARWPETEGTVYSCEWVQDQENGGGWYDVVFTYWGGREIQRGSFRNFGPESESPYFRGDTFSLRYNPRRPSSFYNANELSTATTIFIVVFICVVVISTFVTLLR
jgi:hypothetical protein